MCIQSTKNDVINWNEQKFDDISDSSHDCES